MVQAWGLSLSQNISDLDTQQCALSVTCKGKIKKDCKVDAVPLGKKKSQAEGQMGE